MPQIEQMPADRTDGSAPQAGVTAQGARVERRLQLGQIATSVMAGLLAGLLGVGVLLSLAALIFAGPLAGFVANGIGLLLVGACLMNLAFALFSSRPPMVLLVQEAPAIIIALVVANIAARVPVIGSGAATYATVVAAIAVTTLLTGVTFLALGLFRLGALVRYLPYPVVGGFLAGTGWLLTQGGIGVITGRQLVLAALPGLLQPPLLWQWLPGVLFGIVILVALRRSQHILLLPGLLVGATALFYLWLTLARIPLAEAQAQGWLLGPFKEQALWAPLAPAMLAEIQWATILDQFDVIGTAVVLGVIGLLLNVSGLQLARREELDLNQELRAAGLAQLAAGLIGSPPGFQVLSVSALSYRMGARSRLVGIVVGIVCGAAFFFGAELLALLPRVVLGGLVLYFGLAFLVEWLYDAWFKLPQLDYILVLLILALIALFGMLTGVVAGLAIALVLFVVAYSRIDVVKHTLSGATIKSRMTRSPAKQQLLRTHGEQIAVFQLQGFLFFGTAHAIYERVRRRAMAEDGPALRFVLLDFRLVPRLDSTALLSFTKLLQLAEERGLLLLLSQLTPAVQHTVERSLLRGASGEHVRIFSDLDHALEWCENELLADAGVAAAEGQAMLLPAPERNTILAHFERRLVQPGEYLMRQGDQPEDMFLIEAGQVTAQLETADAAPLRLESMRGGRLVGELGFFLQRERTAAVVADELSVVYRITWPALRQLEQEHPTAAAALHQMAERLLAERVVHLIDTVDALQR